MNPNKLVAALAALSLLTACAVPSQNRFNDAQVGQVAVVQFGTIISEREVDITGKNSGVGAGVGVAGGALAGSYAGRGGGSLAGMLAGAVIGGIAGAAAEQAMADRKGIEYTIAEENGQTVAIVQNIAKDDQPLHKGQRVMVQSGSGYQRVLPADEMPVKVKRPKGLKVED